MSGVLVTVIWTRSDGGGGAAGTRAGVHVAGGARGRAITACDQLDSWTPRPTCVQCKRSLSYLHTHGLVRRVLLSERVGVLVVSL